MGSAAAAPMKTYTESFLKEKVPRSNLICASARQGIHPQMLTIHPFPETPTKALMLSGDAYTKAKNQNPSISPETGVSLLLVSFFFSRLQLHYLQPMRTRRSVPSRKLW